jgi:hypothetical protein
VVQLYKKICNKQSVIWYRKTNKDYISLSLSLSTSLDFSGTATLRPRSWQQFSITLAMSAVRCPVFTASSWIVCMISSPSSPKRAACHLMRSAWASDRNGRPSAKASLILCISSMLFCSDQTMVMAAQSAERPVWLLHTEWVCAGLVSRGDRC